MGESARAIEAVWRIESSRIVATLARMTGDFGLAEDLAQEALVEALEQWPNEGTPRNPGAWLTMVAKRRAIDLWRRRSALEDRYAAIAHDLEESSEVTWEPIRDDVLRLIFTSCHPVLAREAQIALTLRVVSGLTTQEIARMLLVEVSTVQARITRAKKALASAQVPFETPDPAEWPKRLSAVLGVVYLVFTEGYAATSGSTLLRTDLAEEALRLGRTLAALMPKEPDAHALLGLMEFQASRFAARLDANGSPVLLSDQVRSRWDRAQIARGSQALARADELASARGSYAIQAAIAQCHAEARSFEATDWVLIVSLYEDLCRLTPNPVAELNRAVAVSMASGPEAGLEILEQVSDQGQLRNSHLVPSVRGELLARLGRTTEARAELLRAATLTENVLQSDVLRAKAAAL